MDPPLIIFPKLPKDFPGGAAIYTPAVLSDDNVDMQLHHRCFKSETNALTNTNTNIKQCGQLAGNEDNTIYNANNSVLVYKSPRPSKLMKY